jgi:hypothetical protein
MSDIIVTGVDPADKPLEELIRTDVVCAGFDKPGLVWDIVGEFALLFYTYDITVTFIDGIFHEIDKLLCLSGTFEAHDQFYHAPLSLLSILLVLYGSSLTLLQGSRNKEKVKNGLKKC